MMNMNVLTPLLLTTAAGLATGVGGAIALLANKTNTKLLAFALGLSAGVMIYVAFVELLNHANNTLTNIHGNFTGQWIAAAGFFTGILAIAVIDKLVPNMQNPHEARPIEGKIHLCDEESHTTNDGEILKQVQDDMGEAYQMQQEMLKQVQHDKEKHTTNVKRQEQNKQKLLKTSIVTAVAISIHNFPEGVATFMAALDNNNLGIAIASAIAIHNVPEGIAVAIPVLYATGSRKKALTLAIISGVAEPVGAGIAFLFLQNFMTPNVMALVFAGVAGIMVFISIDELLPAAHQYGHSQHAMYGLVAGMAVMAVSLILL
jgi:ZIP family zinc transporter